jgi:uncharacterized SAM-binding protein YcdF (DUF218 family)
MDSVFFWASKILWMLISPDTVFLVLLCSAYLMVLTGWARSGKLVLGISCFGALLVAFFPVGDWLYLPLEKRFEASPVLPDTLDGIILLGGFLETHGSDAWGQVQTNEAAERLLAFQALARQYPTAKLVFTGGNGTLNSDVSKEADSLPPLMESLGLGARELVLESQSRNTWENVQLSQTLVAPRPQEHWLVITSAAHMPRTVGIFCEQQWPIIPYPVDFRANPERALRLELSFADHLTTLRGASREWVGLIAYYFTGKTSHFLPSHKSPCVSAY